MFMYEDDTRLYYLSGHSYESPHNYELVGILMGMAPSNNCLIDIPMCSATYKLLLNQKPDLEDLR